MTQPKVDLQTRLIEAMTRYGRIHPWVAQDAVEMIMPVVKQEIRNAVRKAKREGQERGASGG